MREILLKYLSGSGRKIVLEKSSQAMHGYAYTA